MVVLWLAGCGADVSGTWSGTEDVADNDGNAASYAIDLDLIDDGDLIAGTGSVAPLADEQWQSDSGQPHFGQTRPVRVE